MDEEEARKKRLANYQIGQDLSELSVEDISNLEQDLKNELERLVTERNSKSKHMLEAEKLFKM